VSIPVTKKKVKNVLLQAKLLLRKRRRLVRSRKKLEEAEIILANELLRKAEEARESKTPAADPQTKNVSTTHTMAERRQHHHFSDGHLLQTRGDIKNFCPNKPASRPNSTDSRFHASSCQKSNKSRHSPDGLKFSFN